MRDSVADRHAALGADLMAFAEEILAEPVEWGVNDCSATPCRWLARRGVPLRLPDYRSKVEADTLIAAHGDLAALWEATIDGALSWRIGEPQIGDIAVIPTRLYGGQIGGIVATGSILLIRKHDGQFQWFGPARSFVRVWALPS